MTFDIHVSHDFGPYPVIILIVYGPIILYYMYKIEVPVFLLVFFALGLFILLFTFATILTHEKGFIIKENAPKPEIVSILMPPEEETPSTDEKGQKLLMFFFVLRLIKFFMS